jgi:sulfoxide reductase heme-binding subunit YedZ
MTEQTAHPQERAKAAAPLWLFALTVAVLAVTDIVLWYAEGDGISAIQAYTRWTARIAFIIFALIFAASSLLAIWPNRFTGWLTANRRYLGLNFALAHIVHLGALTVYFLVTDQTPDTITLVFGGLAYVFVVLMALTSNDKSVALLRANWRRLHIGGIYYLWGVFTYTFAGNVFDDNVSALLLFVCIAIMGLCIHDRLSNR